MNNQFQQAFSVETSSQDIPDKGKSHHPQMKSITITEQGVLKLLKQINPNKATGPDMICGKVLKELSTEVVTIITLLFQKNIRHWKNTTRLETCQRLPSIQKRRQT